MEFSVILEHPPYLPWCKQILHTLLVLRTLAVWIWYPWLSLPSFEKLMILVQWILLKNLNHLWQYYLRVQLDLCTFCASPPTQQLSNDICPLMMQSELLHPSSLLHRSPPFYFRLYSGSTQKFSPIFPIPFPLLLLLLGFWWREA